MKVTCNPQEITVSQTNFGRAVGVTVGRVTQLVREGVVFRDAADKSGGVLLVKSLLAYAAYKGEGTSDGGLDYMQEKAKHEKVKRELAELKLAKEANRVYDARTVELVMTEMVSNLRTQLLGLPSKLAPMLDGADKDKIYTVLTQEIEEKLMELSEYTPELFTSEEVSEISSGEGEY